MFSTPHALQVFAAEPLEQRVALTTFLVTTTADSGPGSLRQAILDANAAAGRDAISFALVGGLTTIKPLSPLPDIVSSLILSANSVEIDGTAASASRPNEAVDGLRVIGKTAGGTTISGLIINRFSGDGIEINGTSGNNLIAGNFIGTDADGLRTSQTTDFGVLDFGNGGNGIHLIGGVHDVFIGGTRIAEEGSFPRNIIAGNHLAGIAIEDSSYNIVAGNYIGANRSGQEPYGKGDYGNWGDGILVSSKSAPSSGSQAYENHIVSNNLIVSNDGYGIRLLQTSATRISGNFIGVFEQTIRQGTGNSAGGILAVDCAGTTIGPARDPIANTFPDYRNVISANGGIGIEIRGLVADPTARKGYGTHIIDSDTWIFNNFIGTNAGGVLELGNVGDGILISGGSASARAFVGKPSTFGFSVTALRNVISGNDGSGVVVESPFCTVAGNFIGANVSGTKALGNDGYGVVVRGVGTVVTDVDKFPQVISGNGLGGILLDGGTLVPGPDGALTQSGSLAAITGNCIGTDIFGTGALPNHGPGITITGRGNTVGSSTGLPNIISGNAGPGVLLTDAKNADGQSLSASANRLFGNFIGVDIHGNKALPNDGPGVLFEDGATGNTIDIGNVISGNDDDGVRFEGNASRNGIFGSWIGTDASGTVAIPNSGQGVHLLGGEDNQIGDGSNGGAGNTISGNAGHGIWIENGSVAVSANLIGVGGTDGELMIANNGNGVFVSGSASARIGDSSARGETTGGNVISGNSGHGIELASTSESFVFGNFIGTNAVGAPLGNGADGIYIHSPAGNTIGDGKVSNIIGANGRDGIEIVGSIGNVLVANYIGRVYGDGDLGNIGSGIAIRAGADGTVIQFNTIDANGADGIVVDGASGTQIGGNSIGGSRWERGHGNRGHGIHVSGANATVIGPTLGGSGGAGYGNTIVSNVGAGLFLDGGSTGTQILSNYVEENGLAGIEIADASSTIIGLEAPQNEMSFGNHVAHNAGAGVVILAGVGNMLAANSMFANAGLGIDLGGDGATLSDPHDTDTGPNGLQNTGVLKSIVTRCSKTLVRGVFEGAPFTTVHVEFFANVDDDRDGVVELQTFVGAIDVVADATGRALIAADLQPVAIGQFLSATVTDTISRDTSEFSGPLENIAPPEIFAVGAGIGGAPRVRIFDAASGDVIADFLAFDRQRTAGVRVATGDVDHDGYDDIVVASGRGVRPHAKVFSGVDGSVLSQFFVTGSHGRDGVFVAAGDLDGDGRAEVVVGGGGRGLARVSAFDGLTGEREQRFLAFDRGHGVHVAVGDLDGDGRDEIIAGTTFGHPKIRVFDGATAALRNEWRPFPGADRSGIFVAAGDTTGDGVAEIIAGGPSSVEVYDVQGVLLSQFRAFSPRFNGAIRVATADTTGDSIADIIAAHGAGARPTLRIFTLAGDYLGSSFAFPRSFSGGIFVG